ncbi:tRNA (adenosine(37)-N6)-threonylcarbamoyltransferase complex ATPase subunit type 1 TsaE [Lentimicrobium sp.]|jgi:tRNA threonylcarbamoyladenosine biosynthesis protein TsaE|uniref:tRNA (adenosine(37)-N6)-threonylcarbamoyltransferase complex ATPase subunit type 1 TsaE n=1 Tax=Lentimicrobium sp. TaxID=2034841 RepID=UPI0026014731|nr:tRNA (adenosine(37)-N6)-threonylcarbamoyltransferase complex ATPase subunit type 1 TsaE [Lentimicrobium sp.]HPF63383.1 tRNA (adenosine(37)-N6)-threonylcarbamoyltransferase complex ATPase subunit type 1 TsaE [Lentimicrobium sp.]HPJ62216.1 tRNA (adenosine(37)-N6)-threonylcarbamoyltransferase complex ATPase subunit type 1 TsaE [Lentimicrobium sp.]HPR26009.1 tRNA (adenosine(37)-N6)-threonylcarbamoyltransferase complex ATPase subunit type 1 TsaE [Lentimicrobium sp.]HRW68985.1 tRNA (adenosine(37)-
MIHSDNLPAFQIQCGSVSELDRIGAQMLLMFPEERVFAVSGPMGAGKTTFIQAICRQLGVKDNVSSPTFSIVNEYRTGSGEPVFHFDLYRLRKPEELLDIGYEDYFFSGDYCFIEWPELAGMLIPAGAVKVEITVEEGSGARTFVFIR